MFERNFCGRSAQVASWNRKLLRRIVCLSRVERQILSSRAKRGFLFLCNAVAFTRKALIRPLQLQLSSRALFSSAKDLASVDTPPLPYATDQIGAFFVSFVSFVPFVFQGFGSRHTSRATL